MGLGQVTHVDVVTLAGAVRGRVVLAEHLERRAAGGGANGERNEVDLGASPELARRTSYRSRLEVDDLDVLSMIGLQEGVGASRLDAAARTPFILTRDLLRCMPADGIILSPMPIIDEIAPDARRERRVRILEQSDAAVWVRMAVLELMLGRL